MKKHRINNLELRVSIFSRKYLEIVEWSQNFSHCWTIAIYHYDDEYDRYSLDSVGDRLNDKNIDWYDFGCLVNLGYKWLENKDLFVEEVK